MSTNKDTDYELRTHDFKQTDPERLAIDVLGLNPRYTLREPRRPLGGPDRGRDIEAIFDNHILVWGAVGFQRMVSDAPDEKRSAKQKFKNDLDRAKKENLHLEGFVFFTNVDLTDADQAELEAYGKSKGLKLIDIYWRERIRVALDSPQGIMYRLRYLGIPMTVEDQQAFFAEFGDQLGHLIHKRFVSVDAELQRIRFEM
jgi:hypothetical protein